MPSDVHEDRRHIASIPECVLRSAGYPAYWSVRVERTKRKSWTIVYYASDEFRVRTRPTDKETMPYDTEEVGKSSFRKALNNLFRQLPDSLALGGTTIHPNAATYREIFLFTEALPRWKPQPRNGKSLVTPLLAAAREPDR